jgi:hypothetical protein
MLHSITVKPATLCCTIIKLFFDIIQFHLVNRFIFRINGSMMKAARLHLLNKELALPRNNSTQLHFNQKAFGERL